jgi:hypothetical protein
VLLVMSSALWTSSVQAFFCFSMGGASRHRYDDYPPLPPLFGAFLPPGPPVLHDGPVIPEPPLTPVAPVETRNIDYPAQADPARKQHIFH